MANPGVVRSGLVLERANPDGSLDTSFGDRGTVFYPGISFTTFRFIAVGSDDRIVLTGQSDTGSVLYRLNPDGSPDLTFGGGEVHIGLNISAAVLAIQPDGMVLIGGSESSGNGDFAIARFRADGDLDTSFGDAGEIVTDIASGSNDSISDIVIQADGGIVAGGASAGHLALARYLPGGEPKYQGDCTISHVPNSTCSR